MNRISLSVIIPSFGREDVLIHNVEDILNQTRMPDETIVVLQKVDREKASFKKLCRLADEPSKRLRLCEVEFANAQRARNLALREARGDVVLLLDDDLRLDSKLVEKHLRHYEMNSDTDGVVGQVLEVGQNPTDHFPSSFDWPHLGWQNFPLNYSKPSVIQNWPSTNSSLRRNIAVQVGGFDEQFERTWFDDSDFSFRLIQAGARLKYDPEACVVHLKVPSGGKRPVSHPMLFLDDEGWGVYFYFWRKNFGMWRARYPFLHTLRYYLFRRRLLLHPFYFILNWIKLFKGWKIATQKLKIGPFYLNDKRGFQK